jgi:hypothetical protein
VRAEGGALKPIGTAHPQDRLARVDRPLPASSSGGRLRILCHAEHSKAELGMDQRESGAGPTAGLSSAWEPADPCVSGTVDAARSIAAARGDALSVCESCGGSSR